LKKEDSIESRLYEAGDVVVKAGHSDLGQKGIVVDTISNSLGNQFVVVITESGSRKIWYTKNVLPFEM